MSIPVIAGLLVLVAQGPTTTTAPTTTSPPPSTTTSTTAPSTTAPTTAPPTTAPSTTVLPGCELTPETAGQGDLVWGVKKSFRQYVGVGLAGATGNSITATDGATITALDEVVRDGVPNPTGVPTGAYRFTFDSADYTAPTAFTARYRGTVAFTYPTHFFTLLLSDPWITTAAGTTTLHADIELEADPGAPAQPVTLPDVELARLTPTSTNTALASGVLTWTGVPATLASAEAFAGFYQAGADLDPVTATLGARCAALPEAPPTATPGTPAAVAAPSDLVPPVRHRPADPVVAATGVDVEHGFWFAVTLLLAGLALVLATHRPRGRDLR